MSKILITGGSGFIGTNMIELLEKNNYIIINYDIAKPKKNSQLPYWNKIDILDNEIFQAKLLEDNPDYIIHLAARTDLNEKNNLAGYNVNIEGVENLMEGACKLTNLKKIIIASSMLVCRLGYTPKSFDDYAPNSLYGESKVLTEKIVKRYNLNWVIVRPTSIWGPWFGEPYKNFFDLVIKGLYFNIPQRYASTKTYGFVENTCKQIYSLMVNSHDRINHNYFYLGDIEPINISFWAKRIRKLNNQSSPFTLPKRILMFAAFIGDFLSKFLRINFFPMNSFRYKNMTTNNIIDDLERTIEVTNQGINTNLDNEILTTLNWIKSKEFLSNKLN